jgi:phosphohistidine phosphatase
MHLYLLRHADAGDPMRWDGPDAARPLSDKGRGQSKRLGSFLSGIKFEGKPFITSPKLRASETADGVARRLDVKVIVDERLAGPLSAETVEAILADAGDPERPVLVGHDPDFSELLAVLCGAVGVTMRKGALARIDIDRPLRTGAGTLRWLLPPDVLKSER